jgi:hypothetical protein
VRKGDHAGSIRARVFFQPDRTSDLGELKPLDSQTAVIDRLIVLLSSARGGRNIDSA